MNGLDRCAISFHERNTDLAIIIKVLLNNQNRFLMEKLLVTFIAHRKKVETIFFL